MAQSATDTDTDDTEQYSEVPFDDAINSFSMKRELTRWHSTFTEHWTFSWNEQDLTADYKLRVVGPNGEACRREELRPEEVPRDVRAEFEKRLSKMSDVA